MLLLSSYAHQPANPLPVIIILAFHLVACDQNRHNPAQHTTQTTTWSIRRNAAQRHDRNSRAETSCIAAHQAAANANTLYSKRYQGSRYEEADGPWERAISIASISHVIYLLLGASAFPAASLGAYSAKATIIVYIALSLSDPASAMSSKEL